MLRNKGILFSAILHILFLLMVCFGLPSLRLHKALEEDSISVEILPIKPHSNVPRKSTPAPEKQKEESKSTTKAANNTESKTEKEQVQEKPLQKQESKEKDSLKIPEKKELKQDKKKEEKKPERPVKETPKKETRSNKPSELDSLLKTLDNPATHNNEKAKENTKESVVDDTQRKTSSSSFDPDQELSLSLKDSIKSQIYKCWNLPAGAKDAGKMSVVLKITLNQEAEVTDVKIITSNKPSASSETFFTAFQDSAIRAVKRCSPLQGLSPEQYRQWRVFELNFDPSKMLD